MVNSNGNRASWVHELLSSSVLTAVAVACVNALFNCFRVPRAPSRRHSRRPVHTLGMGMGEFLAWREALEGEMSHGPEEALRRVGWELWDSHARINGFLGKDLPYNLRIPFHVCVGGWQFEGTWLCNPLLGPRGWTLEGLLELQGHEPSRFCIRGGPSEPSGEPREGSGER